MFEITNKIRIYFTSSDERARKARINSLKMLLIKGLSLLCSLLFLPLFLKAFDSIQYGIWATLLSIINWVGFFDVGLGQGLRNRLAEALAKNDYNLANQYINTTYFAVSIIFGLFILIFILVYPYFDWYKVVNAPVEVASEINTVILITVVMTLLSFIARQIVFIFYGMQEPRLVSSVGLVSQVCSLFIVWLSIEVFGLSSLIPYSIIMTVIPLLLYIIYTIWLFYIKERRFSLGFKYVKYKHLSKLLGLGAYFFIIQLCNIILFNSNNFIIAHVLGPDIVSEYHVAYQYMSILSSIFFIITTPYWSAVTDAFTKKEFPWITKTVNELIKWFIVISLIGLVMVVFSKFIFKIWIGDSIEIPYYLVILMYVYILIQCFGNIYISVINGIGKIKLQFRISLISVVLYLPLAILLTQRLELLGLLMSMIFIALLTNLWAPVQFYNLIKKHI